MVSGTKNFYTTVQSHETIKINFDLLTECKIYLLNLIGLVTFWNIIHYNTLYIKWKLKLGLYK